MRDHSDCQLLLYRAFEDLVDGMYRFGHERDSFQLLAQRLNPNVALGMLWLAGRFEIPELQRAVAARLDAMDAGEKCCP